MTWSLSDTERQGLLPDYFDLRAQISLGPAINPGTVQAHLPELYGKGTLYSVKKLPAHGWFVHAPCTITDVRDQADQVAFTAAGWKNKPYYVLLSGVDSVSRNVVVSNTNDPPGDSSTAHKIECRNGLLIIQLNGKSRVNIR